MKLLTVFLIVALAAGALGADLGRVFVSQCREEVGMDEQSLKQFHNGSFVDKSIMKEFILCLCKKGGIMTDDGDLANQDEIKRILLEKYNNNEEESNRIFKKCIVKKDTPQETAYHLATCLHAEH